MTQKKGKGLTMPPVRDWNDQTRNDIASSLRLIVRDVPPLSSAYLNELALAIDNS